MSGKRTCKYYKVRGDRWNCLRCTGYEKFKETAENNLHRERNNYDKFKHGLKNIKKSEYDLYN